MNYDVNAIIPIRPCAGNEITAAQLLSAARGHGERIRIRVVPGPDGRKPARNHRFLTEDFAGSADESDRVLRYYGGVPVHDLHVDFIPEPNGRYVSAALTADCYYGDAKAGLNCEQAERRKLARTRKRQRMEETDPC